MPDSWQRMDVIKSGARLLEQAHFLLMDYEHLHLIEAVWDRATSHHSLQKCLPVKIGVEAHRALLWQCGSK